MQTPGWHFAIDRGGTFTDVVARAPDGTLATAKLLSEDPERYADAAVEAIRQLTGTPPGAPLPPASLRLGTTVATNALLERRGARTVLAITAGLEDALAIGTQERPELFARAIRLPEPLETRVIGVAERVLADGTVERPLDEEAARAAFAAARADGFEAVAIALMHGWAFPAHEARLAELAREAGFAQVSASHAVSATLRLVPRGQTTVADAYLSPVLARYRAGLEAALGAAIAPLYMQSNGALAAGAAFHGKDAVLSGPAGGVVGVGAVAAEAGLPDGMAAVGFDMGGTSTDVCWHAGTPERDRETRLSGVRLALPMLRIHTVAAGGGSVCSVSQGRMEAGPRSAGAQPGPACYGRGGPLTVTDCNLLTGRLAPAHFPAIFGADGLSPLSTEAAEAAMAGVLAALHAETGSDLAPEAAAEGYLAIAVATMAAAIRRVSLARGHDVTRAALVAFGGAGGQLACAVADALGMDTVLAHPLASLLSAHGIGLARQGATRVASLGLPLDEAIPRLAPLREKLAAEAALDDGDAAVEAFAELRAPGTDHGFEVPLADASAMAAAFAAQWQARFGYAAPDGIEVAALRVAVTGAAQPAPRAPTLPAVSAPPLGEHRLHAGGAWHSAPLHARDGLAAGARIIGPALIVDPLSTLVVDPGWTATMAPTGILHLSRATPRAAALPATQSDTVDPVRLAVMGALFMAIAEDMGAALAASARSVNIRERLDFSCALFDATGALVANAPHMPVHLGSMGESVRTVLARRGRGADGLPRDGRGLIPGDAYALNAPYAGGTHLPDVTVVVPVFADAADAAPAWFVAARGHHADIGGISPGSMPPGSQTLAEEGVVLDNLLVVDGSARPPRLCEAELRAVLASGRWPARDPGRNLADLAAQVAACAHGSAALVRLAAEQGRATVDAYMEHVQAAAERAVRDLARTLPEGTFAAPMDNGATIRVALAVDRTSGGLTFDFTGTSPQLSGNFNAPLAVTRAAVLYVLRCLIDADVPMNEGCLRPVTLIVPPGSMLHPGPEAAVVAGNVETSQVLCDALFAACGAMAAAQGTMNNLTFGDATRQYYETIAGGSGAGPGHDGTRAVQTHMTNSRLTDPEVLETAYPVVVERFAIRTGSGGAGQWHGGDGAVRRLRFLEPMQAGILANRRATVPFGLAGGKNGAPGINRVIRADGHEETLGAAAAVTMAPGDVLEILTPGGGGWGEARERK